MAPPFAPPKFVTSQSKPLSQSREFTEKLRLAYPLGVWQSNGSFVFFSPEAAQQWDVDSFMQGSHHRKWMKGRPLNPEENRAAAFGLKHSDDVYQGPDADHYQMIHAAREDPNLTALRAAYMAQEPAVGTATEMARRASLKALPQALYWMAQSGSAAAPANDNRVAANENATRTKTPGPAARELPVPANAAANDNVPPATANQDVAPKVTPKALGERAAYVRSGHVTQQEKQSADDDARLLFEGATAGYGDNAMAALRAVAGYVEGKEFGASYDAALNDEQRKTEEARRRRAIAGAIVGTLPSFIPGYGDVAGFISDLKLYREHPEERNWKNIALTAAGIVPFVPSLAGSIKKVDHALEVAEDGIRIAKKPFRRDYPKTFFEAYPHLKGNVTVHRAIEYRVLNRHPGLFDESEIFGLENLRGIPNEFNSDLLLHRARGRRWPWG